MQRIVDRSEATAVYAPALLRFAEAPAAPGWHPLLKAWRSVQDAPGLVAPAGSGNGATAIAEKTPADGCNLD